MDAAPQALPPDPTNQGPSGLGGPSMQEPLSGDDARDAQAIVEARVAALLKTTTVTMFRYISQVRMREGVVFVVRAVCMHMHCVDVGFAS